MPTELNPQQEKAANELDGPVKIVAGAGTGKTRVLTQRYINLIKSKKAIPENILCVTFTNKASDEMLLRVRREGIDISKMNSWILTFHGFGARILRRHIQEIYPNKRFNIIDTKDSAKIIDEIVTANQIASHLRSKRIVNEISRAKDECLSPAEFQLLKSPTLDYTDQELVTEIYTLYQKYLEEHGYFDFGDLLCKTIDLFNENPAILGRYQEQLRYIQIDEYQDTNLAQHELIMALGGKHKNVCVVGDPDQTIYTWRGARVQNLANFEEQMGTTKSVTLEQNYRSHQNILDFANSLICHNLYREEKDLWSETKSGNKVIVQTPPNQASYISRKIDEFVSTDTYGYKDICILYRNNNMSGAIETELLRSAIPYDTRDIAFYQRAEIKDSIAYLKVLADPEDDIQLERILNTPRRSLGKMAITKLREWTRQNSASLFEALLNLESITGLSAQAKKGCQKLLTSLEETWNEHGNDLEKAEVFTAALESLFEKIEYFEYLKKVDEKERDRAESSGESNRYQNVASLLEICKGADGLDDFLEAITLNAETDDSESTEKVSLMTIHRAKGLEYPIVFVINMAQYQFPRITDDEDELEEERRLAYVAFTRAEDTLILTWPEDYQPSQFVMEACSRSEDAYEFEWAGA